MPDGSHAGVGAVTSQWGAHVSPYESQQAGSEDSDQLLGAPQRTRLRRKRRPSGVAVWGVFGAALFVGFLAVPGFAANAVSTNRNTSSGVPSATTSLITHDQSRSVASSGAVSSQRSKWALPPGQLLALNGTGYSLDTNGVAPIASTIGTPGEIFHSIGDDVINALITLAIVLFIAFPANIFNQALSENYAEIQVMKENARRKIRSAVGMSDHKEPDTSNTDEAADTTTNPSTPGASTRGWFIGTLAIGALFGGFLDPHFGFNAHSLESLIATFVAFSIGALLSWFIAKTFRSHHKYPTQTYLKALPLGLGVAFACVFISRITHFEPGYLYGVVVGIAFVASMKDQHNYHLIVISTLSTLSVALIAWFIWIPVNHVALEGGGNFVLAILDDVLGSIFIGGIIGSVIGLLPLEGLSGGTLVKWRRDVWAGVFGLAVFLLVSVELRPSSGPTHPGGAPVVTAILLFVGFAGLSFYTRWYFAQRKLHQPPGTATPSGGDS